MRYLIYGMKFYVAISYLIVGLLVFKSIGMGRDVNFKGLGVYLEGKEAAVAIFAISPVVPIIITANKLFEK